MAEHEPTRAELQQKLVEKDAAVAAMEARLKALEERPAAAPVLSPQDLALLNAARLELQELRPGASRAIERPRGPAPKLERFAGTVRARTDCFYGGYHKKGELFEVDVATLWSDDPYEPVKVDAHEEEITDENGQSIGSNRIIDKVTRRMDVPVIDFRFRTVEDPGHVSARAM